MGNEAEFRVLTQNAWGGVGAWSLRRDRLVKAIAEGTIKWEKDPDFGYLVATEVPGIDDPDFLQPRNMYERQGRADEYRQLV